jgi:hypothetical protein
MTNDPFLSPDGKFWIDPSDGRSVPVVRGSSDTDPAPDPSPAPETPPATDDPAASPAPSADPEHSFQSVDDAVKALKETRAEAAQRRIEAKQAKEQAQKYLDSFAGYTDAEQEQVLAIFRDLADPNKQVAAAQRLADISSRLLESDGGVRRPTGEDDPDEQPLTRKEWKELQQQRDQEAAQTEALKQLESEASAKGYPPDSPGYTVLLSAMMDPDVAGDMDKAVEKVKAYETSIVETYRKQVEQNGERWPGSGGGSPTPPSDPEAGVKPGWGNARAAAAAFLKARAGQA